ncbi:MAG: hypothetical protein WBZ19_21995, partial [Chthoniobacterales bacterium]
SQARQRSTRSRLLELLQLLELLHCHLHATPLLSAPFMFEVSKGNNGNKMVEQNYPSISPASSHPT